MNRQLGLTQKSTLIGTILVILSIACIAIFSVKYYFENELIFSNEIKFILILVGGLFFLVCLFVIYLSILIKHTLKKSKENHKKIEMIYSIVVNYKSNFESIDIDMAEIEDNLVLNIRETQNLIMELKQGLGVGKCSETQTPIEVKSGGLETH